MRSLPAVVELVSGELVAGAEAPAAALTGEGFLPAQPNVPHADPPPHQKKKQHSLHRVIAEAPALDLHLPILCVCKDEPRASRTY